jgi:hypothetical protein
MKKISNIYLFLSITLSLFFLTNIIRGIKDFNYPNSGISKEFFVYGTLMVWMVINAILYTFYSLLKRRYK